MKLSAINLSLAAFCLQAFASPCKPRPATSTLLSQGIPSSSTAYDTGSLSFVISSVTQSVISETAEPLATSDTLTDSSETVLSTATSDIFVGSSETVLSTATSDIFVGSSETVLSTATSDTLTGSSETVLSTATSDIFAGSSETVFSTSASDTATSGSETESSVVTRGTVLSTTTTFAEVTISSSNLPPATSTEAPTPTGYNYIVNPGFEDGLLGWTKYGVGANGVVSLDSEQKHSGKASGSFSVSGGDGPQGINMVLGRLRLLSDADYVFTAYIRIPSGSACSDLYMGATTNSNAPIEDAYTQVDITGAVNQWKRIQTTVYWSDDDLLSHPGVAIWGNCPDFKFSIDDTYLTFP